MKAGAPFAVLYEDNHLLVACKPPGMPVQPDASGDADLTSLVRDDLARRHHKPGRVYASPAHRLDRPASGVVVFARTSKAAGRLAAQFRERAVDKTYRAVVEGRIEPIEGELVDALEREWTPERGVTARLGAAGSEARLRYRQLERRGDRALLEVSLITGRSHQIRAQLAARGVPIAGDTKYGSRRALPGRMIALLAWRLALEHPVRGERVAFEAPEPEHWPWP